MKQHRVLEFPSCRRAVSAIEFAFVFPVLLLLMLAGFQLVLYLDASRKVAQVASSVSEMVSQAAPPGNSTVAMVNALDLHFSYDSALLAFPYIMKDALAKGIPWWQDIQISYASINFRQISNSCSGLDLSSCYVANVVWTSSGVSGNNYRPCSIPQVPVDDTATMTRFTLPRSIFGPWSVIAIDVKFKFVPSFGAGLVPSLTIQRSVFLQPRYASLINLDPSGNDGIASSCT